eukprot:scaffold13679_cov54-Attheya_sp.AAC.1
MKVTSLLFLFGYLSSSGSIFGRAQENGLPTKSCAATDDEKTCNAKLEAQDLQRELIEWMRSEDAFINEKQEVRLVDPQDPRSGYGVFAKERIKEGETLVSVPFNLAIHKGRLQRKLPCETIDELLEEMEDGDKSDFAPYVRYLKSIPEGELPDGWSNAGQELFDELLGEKLPPQQYKDHWLDVWNSDLCDGEDDPYENWVALLVAKRHEDGFMVPYLDFFNHRNGDWTNAEITMYNDLFLNNHEVAMYADLNKFDDAIEVVATSRIEAGEQIYITQNMCNDCNDQEKNGYGTPDLLRDYGFVEDFPQRWAFQLAGKRKVINLAEEDDGSGELEVSWEMGDSPPKRNAYELEDNLKHLDRFDKAHQENTGDIPDNEWNIIKNYHNALTVANKAILEHMLSDDYDEDQLNLDENDVYWGRHDSCYDDGHYIDREPFRSDEHEKCEDSMFQTLCYSEAPKDRNKCFDLDMHVQICSDHRSHYHEPFVHFTTSFLKELKRVAFVGGGDNMILNEVLKYPTVEFVIGLELDQKCVRNSFKHFHTQPHFEDERVHWWFGDATKTLTMLPKEYFGSFDLVMVDLSETATSLTVTERLDMFEALALLVKPDGIFVKNEVYIKKLRKIFDHTITVYEDHVPMVCKQDFTMASNKIDFLKPNFELMRKYKPETYVYKPLDDINTHYRIFRDYSKTDARAQGKCGKLDEKMYDSDEQRRAGIVLIVEAENAKGASMSAEKMEKTLKSAILKEGLSPVSTIAHASKGNGVVVIIITEEGYIIAHTWPDHSYVALEIHLWSQFVKLDKIKSSLLKAVGSTKGPWSTYRVVAGGMLGTDDWKREQATIGPRPIQSRDCEPTTDSTPDETTVVTVIEESLSIIENMNTTALILCGDHTKYSCKSLEASKQKGVKSLVAVWTCPAGQSGESSDSSGLKMNDGIVNLVLCGDSMDSTKWLEDIVEKHGKVGFVAVDPEATPAVVRSFALLSILDGIESDIDAILTENTVIVVPILDPRDKSRMALVHRSRRRREISEYVAVHEVTVGNIATGMKFWFIATRQPAFLSHVADIASSIKERTGIETAITGNRLDIMKDQVPFAGYVGTVDDYETVPGLLQFANQLPLGHQSIYQFEYKNETPLSTTKLKGALDRALLEMNLSVSSSATSSESGDGALIVSALNAGHAIILWDGGTRIDTNLLTYGGDIQHDVFGEKIMSYIAGLDYVLRDEMPRGTGHVVNSMDEIGTRTPGCYDVYQWCSIYSEEGKCTTDKEWMENNCSKTCGVC